MPDSKNLVHIVKLLDDESEVVQQAVRRELAAFGPDLKQEIARLGIPINPTQRRILSSILEDYYRQWLREQWPTWQKLRTDTEKLECALSLLADFQYSRSYPVKLSALLDELAEEYGLHYRERNAQRLAAFLFQTKGLKGTQSEYYHPRNSNLIHAIEEKEGLPISLACVYILVGHRLGLRIEGCNVPGHFMAKIRLADQIVLVDCFNGGRFIDEKTFLVQQPYSNHALLNVYLPAESIVGRVLYNLINAYQHVKHMDNARLMIELLNDLKHKLV